MSESSFQKLEIRCYRKDTFAESDENKDLRYTALLNPDKYSQTWKTEYITKKAAGSSGDDPGFKASAPSELSLEFLFDRTGVIPHFGKDKHYNKMKTEGKLSDDNRKKGEKFYADIDDKGIEEDLKNFKAAVFDYDGQSHKPNYLKVIWGHLVFDGILTDLTFEYKMFKPNGSPLRAIAKVKFISYIEAEKRAKAEDKKSPDLTHVRTVKAGDTLSLMTHRIYGDPKYYLEVAKANKLTNFRKLTPGQELFFPPLEKVSQQ